MPCSLVMISASSPACEALSSSQVSTWVRLANEGVPLHSGSGGGVDDLARASSTASQKYLPSDLTGRRIRHQRRRTRVPRRTCRHASTERWLASRCALFLSVLSVCSHRRPTTLQIVSEIAAAITMCKWSLTVVIHPATGAPEGAGRILGSRRFDEPIRGARQRWPTCTWSRAGNYSAHHRSVCAPTRPVLARHGPGGVLGVVVELGGHQLPAAPARSRQFDLALVALPAGPLRQVTGRCR